MGLVIDKIKGPLLHKHKGLNVIAQKAGQSPGAPIFKFGYLYNWYAAFDARSISAPGWHVPVYNDFYNLVLFLDPSAGFYTNNAAPFLKATDASWNGSSSRLNTTGFNARGAGLLDPNNQQCESLLDTFILWSYNVNDNSPYMSCVVMSSDNDSFVVPKNNIRPVVTDIHNGCSIRLLKNSTTLTNGQTGTYTGNNGIVYPTICIGNQEWISENLVETIYANGDTIPEVTDYTTWNALSTGARASYNNDHSNAYSTGTVIISEGDSLIFKEGSNIQLSLEDNILTITATASTVTDIIGNAGTATKLQTARNINGVPFDGSSDITVPASQKTKNLMITLSTAL